MKLFLLRHARSAANERQVWTGQSDPELSPEGIAEQLEACSRYDYPQCGIYFASPLKRCTASLEIVYGRKADRLLTELMECSLGSLEGKRYSNLDDDVNYLSWIKQPELCPHGGESFSGFTARARAGFRKMVEICVSERAASACAVLHGNVMRAILSGFVDQSLPHFAWEIPNCGGYLFDFDKTLEKPLSYEKIPAFLFRQDIDRDL